MERCRLDALILWSALLDHGQSRLMALTSASIAAEGGRLRISDVNRATFSTLLVEVLPAEKPRHAQDHAPQREPPIWRQVPVGRHAVVPHPNVRSVAPVCQHLLPDHIVQLQRSAHMMASGERHESYGRRE